MEPLNEQLLAAWLEMSTVVVNSRIVSELTYREALVCNALYKHLPRQQDAPLNATRLCRLTGMLKSQMNRTLTALEKKGLVIRSRSSSDKRQIHVRFNTKKAQAYRRQHERILALVDSIVERLGQDTARQAVKVLRRLSTVAAAQLQEFA